MKLRLDKYSQGTSGRHETFVPRYGWLTKGYVRCAESPHVFNDDDAIEQLGVGKNMVRSIRFWCLVLGLLEEPGKDSDLGKGALSPGALGIRLIGQFLPVENRVNTETGWDPYLEDIASLWLLHWQIFRQPFNAVSWPLAFNFCGLQSFSQQELGASIIDIAGDDARLAAISPRSYEKDAVCIIHMYTQSAKIGNEIRCPFNALGLIKSTPENSHFCFDVGKKNTLPPLIFLAACFSYAESLESSTQTLSLNQIVYGADSPGIAFKMTETECGRLLEQAVNAFGDVRFIEFAGTRQLHFDGEPSALYWACLEQYYKERR